MNSFLWGLVLVLAFLTFNTLNAHAAEPSYIYYDKQAKTLKDSANGEPYFIRGAVYGVVPIGDTPDTGTGGGDYYTIDYAYLWMRDLPLMKKMGVNTIRVYGWDTKQDHTDFLNTCYSYGIRVVYTHFIEDLPVSASVATLADLSAVTDGFVSEVKKYATHPAILMFVFGNEINGDWAGRLQQFNTIYNCGWTESNCYQSDTAACKPKAECVYKQFFGWINSSIKKAKESTKKVIGVGLSDVDSLVTDSTEYDKLALYSSLLSDIDAICLNVYRGKYFGTLFTNFNTYTKGQIALLVGEYGVDSYNDPCGWAENSEISPCRNNANDGIGGVSTALNGKTPFVGCNSGLSGTNCVMSGEDAQADYDLNMATEIEKARDKAVIGGIVMAWIDEYWKGGGVSEQCQKPCPVADLDKCMLSLTTGATSDLFSGCTSKAHITCGSGDLSVQALCGFPLDSMPDRYVNEEWFGIVSPKKCSYTDSKHKYDTISSVRSVYFKLQELWSKAEFAKGAKNVMDSIPTCETIGACEQCLAKYKSDYNAVKGFNSPCKQQCKLASSLSPTPNPDPTNPNPTSSAPFPFHYIDSFMSLLLVLSIYVVLAN